VSKPACTASVGQNDFQADLKSKSDLKFKSHLQWFKNLKNQMRNCFLQMIWNGRLLKFLWFLVVILNQTILYTSLCIHLRRRVNRRKNLKCIYNRFYVHHWSLWLAFCHTPTSQSR